MYSSSANAVITSNYWWRPAAELLSSCVRFGQPQPSDLDSWQLFFVAQFSDSDRWQLFSVAQAQTYGRFSSRSIARIWLGGDYDFGVSIHFLCIRNFALFSLSIFLVIFYKKKWFLTSIPFRFNAVHLIVLSSSTWQGLRALFMPHIPPTVSFLWCQLIQDPLVLSFSAELCVKAVR